MILKIEKLTIYVDSQDDALKFWTDKMGFQIVLDQPMGPNARWIEIAPNDDPSLTTIVLFSKALMLEQSPESVAHPSIMFSSIEIEQVWEQLKNNGVEVSEIKEYPYGKLFDFRDNEGNPYMMHG
jgi:lactoylglutathione lyase